MTTNGRSGALANVDLNARFVTGHNGKCILANAIMGVTFLSGHHSQLAANTDSRCYYHLWWRRCTLRSDPITKIDLAKLLNAGAERRRAHFFAHDEYHSWGHLMPNATAYLCYNTNVVSFDELTFSTFIGCTAGVREQIVRNLRNKRNC